MEKNHYKTLGVPRDADEKKIRSAYRNLAKKFHPDTGEVSSAEEFHAVQGAYEVLSDPEKRLQYDLRPAIRQVEEDACALCTAPGPQALRASDPERVFQHTSI